MNNSLVESALKAWIVAAIAALEDEDLAGVVVLTGMDIDEMPLDAQAVVCAVPSIARPVAALGLATVAIVVASPFHTSTLAAHRALVGVVQTFVADFAGGGLASQLTSVAGLTLAGVSPKDTENDSEGNRWLTTVPFLMGLRAS